VKSAAFAPLVRLFTRVECALDGSPPDALLAALSRLILRHAARRLLAARALPVPAGSRLFALTAEDAELERKHALDPELALAVEQALGSEWAAPSALPAEALGGVFEALLGLGVHGDGSTRRLVLTRRRKNTGAFYTPSSLSQAVVEHALAALGERAHAEDLRVCDPACGAGAFLVEAARALVARREARSSGGPFDRQSARRTVVQSLAGVDLDPLALDMARLVLWMFVADPALELGAIRLAVGDALTGAPFQGWAAPLLDERGIDWATAFPAEREHGFDLVVGNPPWMAFAGRAAQPLPRERRAWFSRHYAAFRGYPTLHALFVERALSLAPRGVVALVVPSPLADLAGYRSVRRRLFASHVPCEPLLEFGQDAFAEVTQPCFALLARPRAAGECEAPGCDRAFVLRERSRASAEASAVAAPAVLERLRRAAPLPREVFGEMGFQTTRIVTSTLLLRSAAPDAHHTYPLLEGREVAEFRVGPPRLFLRPDAELLRRAGCRLRSIEEYRRVSFVVRQTAKAPIAALHSGLPFRNSLLAGFETDELPADLLVGLLNSALYRALHVAAQRDARQAVFPQVKLSHLRALPRPPSERGEQCGRIRGLARKASGALPSRELRRALDAAVFELFDVSLAESEQIERFLRDRAPELLAPASSGLAPEISP